MNRKRILRDCTPPGVDPLRELGYSLLWFVLFVLFGAVLVFVIRYTQARGLLYTTVLGRRVLYTGAQIAPLEELLRGVFLPALGYAVICLVQIGVNYASFYRGAKSVYLMRRVPDRWELPRRCAAIPLLALAAGLLLTAGCVLLCDLIYFKATPPQCIPAGQHVLFWRAFG